MTADPQLAPGSASVSPAAVVSVVLVDDHEGMRRNLRRLLDGEDGVEVVAEAGDLATGIRHVFAARPRVLVIDLNMSDGSSTDAVRLLRREVPATAVVALTMEQSRTFAQAALDAGAIGFVLKQAAEAELPQAVRDAARGERYMSPRLTAQIGSLPDGALES